MVDIPVRPAQESGVLRKLLALTVTAALTIVSAAVPAAASGADETAFVSLINSARDGDGLTTLEVYWDLTDDARRHTGEMIEAGEIFHSSNLASITSDWESLGENVGVGADSAQLHEAFMSSPGHRANIMNPVFNYVGVGADHGEDGYLYVTVIFMAGPPGLVSPPEEQETSPPPAEEPLPAAEPPQTEAPPPEEQPDAGPEPAGAVAVPVQRVAPPPPDPAQPTPLAALVLELFAQGRTGYGEVLSIE